MKLNVGCGQNYLDGYVNIDIDKKAKADKIMPAYNLDFENEVFDEILAKQIIEHLGFFKTKYFLSEAYRTLKDGKLLIIETPHIEKAFENFLKAKNMEERERVLGWIYGSETENMTHIYCFPVELMENFAKEFGFIIEKIEFYDYEFLRPAVRYYFRKKMDKYKHLKALMRKELLKSHFPKWGDELSLSEQEKMISQLDFEHMNEKDIIKLYGFNPVFIKALKKVLKEGK